MSKGNLIKIIFSFKIFSWERVPLINSTLVEILFNNWVMFLFGLFILKLNLNKISASALISIITKSAPHKSAISNCFCTILNKFRPILVFLLCIIAVSPKLISMLFFFQSALHILE